MSQPKRLKKPVSQVPMVEYTLTIEDEDISFRGHFNSDDKEADRRLEDEIAQRLDRGDLWAWCCVKVTAQFAGFKGVTYLGACCYLDEAEFKEPGGYYDDMKADALADLKSTLKQAIEEGERARLALTALDI